MAGERATRLLLYHVENRVKVQILVISPIQYNTIQFIKLKSVAQLPQILNWALEY